MTEQEMIAAILDELPLHLVKTVKDRLYDPTPMNGDDKRDMADKLRLFLEAVDSLTNHTTKWSSIP